MEIKNRLFPYPVLCDETDDYDDETCNVTSVVDEKVNNISIRIVFHLTDPALLDLIRAGYAEYALHLECSTTSFRKLIRSDTSEISYSIPTSRVKNEVAVLAMIVARRKIENFNSDYLNSDYIDTTINFEKASILAYTNMPKIFVQKNYEELSGNDSFFSVVKVGNSDDDIIKPLTFDLTSDRIKIFVDPTTYEAFIHYQDRKFIAMSMLVLPALVYAIDELRNDNESFSNAGWLIKIKKFYCAQGKDFYNDVIDTDRNVMEIAQEMLNSPIGNAYKCLLEDEA
jgi:hypothetical protein